METIQKNIGISEKQKKVNLGWRNLIPAKKGECRNPKGRPKKGTSKKELAAEIIRSQISAAESLELNSIVIVEKAIQLALSDPIKYQNVLLKLLDKVLPSMTIQKTEISVSMNEFLQQLQSIKETQKAIDQLKEQKSLQLTEAKVELSRINAIPVTPIEVIETTNPEQSPE